MEHGLTGKRPTFHQERRGTSFYRIILLLGLIIAGVWVMLMIRRQQIISPFEPTPTPTRIAEVVFPGGAGIFRRGEAG